MKLGILFAVVSALLTVTAIYRGGWHFVLLWPAVSFAVVALGYLFLGPCVFGKSNSGVISMTNLLLLLPYLLSLWSTWHILRLLKSEPSIDQLNDRIYISRRLRQNELPPYIDHVIDLTCEFSEPAAIRRANYHSFQILDGSVPSLDELNTWVGIAAKLSGNILIHCAEGRGRIGMFAAALLLKSGQYESAADSLAAVRSKRPSVRLARRQLELLASMPATSE